MTTATSTKGTLIHMGKAGAMPAALVPTAITKAKPAVVSVADTSTIKAGDLVKCDVTGFPELDGKWFVAGTVAVGTFALAGSDTTGSSGALAASPSIHHLADSDLANLTTCLSDIAMAREAPAAIEAGTYADPTMTVTSQVVKAGTFAFKGQIDITDPAYAELLAAEKDGLARPLKITLVNNGAVIAPVTVAMTMQETPLSGSQAFSGTMVMATAPRHLF
jgi:hypothetical protein